MRVTERLRVAKRELDRKMRLTERCAKCDHCSPQSIVFLSYVTSSCSVFSERVKVGVKLKRQYYLSGEF